MSQSLEDYLKVIYLLHLIDQSVQLMDIAEKACVSKASASRAVSILVSEGFVEHDLYGPVLLTEKGIEAAETLLAKHKTIKEFLIRVLNVDEILADSEACTIEHKISDTVLRKMAGYA